MKIKYYSISLKSYLIIIILFLIVFQGSSQSISINVGQNTPQQMVEEYLTSGCFTVSDVTYTGDSISIGTFEAPGNNFVINNGIILSTGKVINAMGPNDSAYTTFNTTGVSDSLLGTIATHSINDAARLEYSFTTSLDSYSIQFVFGSEEYLEWVNSSFIDVVGIFVSGPNPAGGNYLDTNIALVPDTNMIVNVNTINNTINTQYFINNGLGATPNNEAVQYDGYTVTITASIPIIPNEGYTVKIIIGDVGDSTYDSAIFFRSDLSMSPTPNYDISYCESDTTIVSFDSTSTYLWADGSTNSTFPVDSAGLYYVTMSSTNCTVADSVELILANNPVNNFDSITTICDSSIILFPGSAESYLWDDGSTDMELFVDQMGQYSVTMSNGPCEVADTTEVIFYPIVDVDLGNDIEICEGEYVTLSLNSFDTYLWSTGTTGSSIDISIQDTYWVSVTNIYDCSDTDTIQLDFINQVIASFNFQEAYSTVELFNQSENAIDYIWDFGDGSALSYLENPIHHYASSPNNEYYSITLVASNQCGSDTSQIDIMIFDIDDTDTQIGFEVFPNPTDSKLFIQTSSNKEYKIFLRNSLGQLIFTNQGISSNFEIDLHEFPDGIYLLEIQSENGSEVYKIVKE